MSPEAGKVEVTAASKAPVRGPAGPGGSGPPKFKQRNTRQFKSKPPKRGVIG